MGQINRRQALRMLGGMAAAPLVTAGCTGGSADSSSGAPVRIGAIIPQTGIYKAIGDDLRQGFDLFLKLNGQRLGGREVRLIIMDETDNAENAKAAANKLINEEHVLALTGVVSSTSLNAIRDIVENAHVPLIGSNASPIDLQGAYIWRTSFVNDEPGKALGNYLARRGPGPMYLIAADYQAGRDEIGGFTKTFQSANPPGRIAGTVYTPYVAGTVYTPYFQQIKESNARGIFCFYAGQSGVEFVKQFRDFSPLKDLPLYAPGFLTEGDALKKLGPLAKDIFTSMNYSVDVNNPQNDQFVTEYMREFKTPPTCYSVAAHDAAAVISKAILTAGADLNPQSLNAALGRLGQITSPRGGWQFNQTRTPMQKWYLRRVVQDGAVYSNTVIRELDAQGFEGQAG